MTSSTRLSLEIDKKHERQYEGGGNSFPKELADAVNERVSARGLSPEQAADEIGISLNVLTQVCQCGSPKGARKVRAKVKTWLSTHENVTESP